MGDAVYALAPCGDGGVGDIDPWPGQMGAWLHKMVRPGRDLLGGAVDAYVGGRETGVVGRQTKTKSIVAIAAEVRGRGTGRIRMSRVEDVAARSLIPFVHRALRGFIEASATTR